MNHAPTPESAQAISNLMALASDARRQYLAEIAAGGEPVYPAWIDDVATLFHELIGTTAAQGAFDASVQHLRSIGWMVPPAG